MRICVSHCMAAEYNTYSLCNDKNICLKLQTFDTLNAYLIRIFPVGCFIPNFKFVKWSQGNVQHFYMKYEKLLLV